MSNLECQNIKWFKAQQQPVITANVLIRPLLKCGSKTASFIHTQTQTCSFGSESTVTAGAEHIIALSQRSLTTDVIMQHGVVYENVYLWNKHQLRRGFFRPGGVPDSIWKHRHWPQRTWAVFWQSPQLVWWQGWWSWWTHWRPPGRLCRCLMWGLETARCLLAERQII